MNEQPTGDGVNHARFLIDGPEGERVAVSRAEQVSWLKERHPLARFGHMRTWDIGACVGQFGKALLDAELIFREDYLGWEPFRDQYEPHVTGADVMFPHVVVQPAEAMGEFVFRKPEPKFDLIAFNHVLEHLDDPLEALDLAEVALRNRDARIMVAVPHSDDQWAWAEEGHLWMFNDVTLARVADRAGLSVKDSRVVSFAPGRKELWMMLGR